MSDEEARTGTPQHARVHARASASAGLSCAPALDDQRASRAGHARRPDPREGSSRSRALCREAVTGSAHQVKGRDRHGPRRQEDNMIQRMDNVLIVVEDLEAAKAFFAEL